jgi:hypothetical protein
VILEGVVPEQLLKRLKKKKIIRERKKKSHDGRDSEHRLREKRTWLMYGVTSTTHGVTFQPLHHPSNVFQGDQCGIANSIGRALRKGHKGKKDMPDMPHTVTAKPPCAVRIRLHALANLKVEERDEPKRV